MKKLLVLVMVLCLALGGAGIAAAATNPYEGWYLGGNWNVSVNVTEYDYEDENGVFLKGFDPALRNSFLDLQSSYENALFRAILPAIPLVMGLTGADAGDLENAAEWLQEIAPYNLRMAVPELIDIILGNIPKSTDSDEEQLASWQKMQTELEALLSMAYFVLPISPDINIADYSEIAADTIVLAVQTVYDTLSVVGGLDISFIQGNIAISGQVDLEALEKLILETLYGQHAADLKALLTYVMQHPQILSSLGSYITANDDDLFMLLKLIENASNLQSYKSASSATTTGTGTMVITSDWATAELGEEEISAIATNYLLAGGVPVSWTTATAVDYLNVPVIENALVEIAGDPAVLNAMQTGVNNFVMTVTYDDGISYIVESYVAQREGTTPPGPTPTPSGGGGSSGCNAGMMPMLLLGLAAVPFFRKK